MERKNDDFFFKSRRVLKNMFLLIVGHISSKNIICWTIRIEVKRKVWKNNKGGNKINNVEEVGHDKKGREFAKFTSSILTLVLMIYQFGVEVI